MAPQVEKLVHKLGEVEEVHARLDLSLKLGAAVGEAVAGVQVLQWHASALYSLSNAYITCNA